jgi:hypothetical protein
MNASPIYDPGQAFTGVATGAAVTGARILKIAGSKVDGGNVKVAHCGGSDKPVGASAADAAQDAVVTVYRSGHVLKVEAAGNVTAGQAVEVTTGGKVQTLSSGTKVGVAFSDGSTSSAPLVQLQF